MNKKLKDEWFILPIIFLSLSLVFRFCWTFIQLSAYPSEGISDASNHISFLFFLIKYGFHEVVPNYWNGFVLFSRYAPVWHFLALPSYYLTGSIVWATFISLIQNLGLGLAFFIFFIGRLIKISIIKSIAFFLLFFASPLALDYMQIGRYPELTAWILFIPFFALIIWYMNQKIDLRFFLLFIPSYSLVLLTHTYTFFIVSFLLIGLCLIKNFKEKLLIILAFILSLAVTSFWWKKSVIFMLSNVSNYKASFELLDAGSIISYNTIILISFFTISYIYLKDKKEEILFYCPFLIFGFLLLTRLVVLIPVINNFYIMPYNMFFLFLTLFLFFKTDFRKIPYQLRRFCPIILILLTLGVFIFSSTDVNYYKRPLPLRDELLSLLPYIEGRYIFLTSERMGEEIPHSSPKIYDVQVMDYAIIHYNLSTPFGTHHPAGVVRNNMKDDFSRIYGCKGAWEEECQTKSLDCDTIKDFVIEQDIKSLIIPNEDSLLLKSCGYKEKVKRTKVSLFLTLKEK